MIRNSACAILFVGILFGHTMAATVVLPPALETAEGSTSDSRTLGRTGPVRLQVVYAPSLLGNLSPGDVIVGLSFRVNGNANSIPTQTVSSYEISLSTSNNPAGSLSAVFADNIGSDVVQVRSGPLSIGAGDFPGGSVPNAFSQELTFSAPFLYTGGPLLVEFIHTDFPGGSSNSDGAQGSAVQAAVGSTATATTANMGLFNYAPAIQLVTVPETNTWLGLAIGMVGLWLQARQRLCARARVA